MQTSDRFGWQAAPCVKAVPPSIKGFSIVTGTSDPPPTKTISGKVSLISLLRAPSKPIAVRTPGGSADFPLQIETPKQGSQERQRPAFLRQASDISFTDEPASDSDSNIGSLRGSNAQNNQEAPPPPAPLGSWAGRVTHFPVPPRTAQIQTPAASMKARKAVPRHHEAQQQEAVDAAWRFRFRRKWRREQLRALLGGPDDDSPPTAGRWSSDIDGDSEELMWPLEGLPSPPKVQRQPSAALDTPPLSLLPPEALLSKKQPLPPAVKALPPLKIAVANAAADADATAIAAAAEVPKPVGEVLEGGEPGSTIRKVVMRGPSHAAKLKPRRMWLPKGQVGRASQAA